MIYWHVNQWRGGRSRPVSRSPRLRLLPERVRASVSIPTPCSLRPEGSASLSSESFQSELIIMTPLVPTKSVCVA